MGERRSGLVWLVWGSALLCYVVAVVNRSSLSAIGVEAQQHFGIEATALSIFVVIQLGVYAACQIPVGIMLDRFGGTVMVSAGAALMVAGQATLAFADDLGFAILARVLIGAGDACTFISVMRMLGEWFAPRRLPIVTQVTGQVGQLGQIVSVVPLAAAVDGFGWRSAFLGLTAVSAFALLAGVLVLRDRPGDATLPRRLVGRAPKHRAPAPTEAFTAPITLPSGRRLGFIASIGHLLRLPGVRLAFWTHWTTCFCMHVFMLLWGKPFLVGGEGFSNDLAASVLSGAVVFSMLAGLSLGPITARFAERRMWVVAAVSLALLLAWSTVLLWPGRAPLWVVMVLVACIAVGGPTSMIAFEVVRTHTPVQQVGLATGIVNMGGFTGSLTAIFGIGLILDLLGAGSPDTYSTEAFKVAMGWQIPLLLLGFAMLLVEWPKAKRALGGRLR